VATPDPRGAVTDVDRAIDPAGFVRVLDALTIPTSPNLPDPSLARREPP
jgi:hypothetical protein